MSFICNRISQVLILSILFFSCNVLEKEKVKAKRNFWFENSVQQNDQLVILGKTALSDSLRTWLKQKERILNHFEPFCEVLETPNELAYQVVFTQKNLNENIYKIAVNKNIIQVNYSNEQLFYTQQFDFLNEFKVVCHELFVNQRKNSLLKAGYLKKEHQELIDLHPWTMKIPDDFKIVRHKENFLWIRTETTSQNSHLMISKIPYVSEEQLGLSKLVDLRDSLAKHNFLYKKYDSTAFMKSEGYFPVTIRENSFSGFYSKRLQGAWSIDKTEKKGFALGGVYVGYAIADTTKPKDFYYLEAFFSAPNTDKLPFIRTLEGILRTFQLNNTSYE